MSMRLNHAQKLESALRRLGRNRAAWLLLDSSRTDVARMYQATHKRLLREIRALDERVKRESSEQV